MDPSGLIKPLQVPPGYEVPRRLVHDDVVAQALTRDDLDDDVRGINASLELIRDTRGGGWPTAPVTAEEDFVDLVWHELELREGYSFAYALRERDEAYLGCCYLYPMGRRTPLTDQLLVHDVDVSWWVTPDGYARGYYARAFRALQAWLRDELPFAMPHFSNREIPADP